MPDDSEVSPLEALMRLSLFRLTQSDEQYEAICQDRLARLAAMKGSSHQLNDAVDRAISLTNSAHNLAVMLASYKKIVRDAATPERRLQDAILSYRENAKIAAEELHLPPLEDTTSAEQKAYAFFKVLLDNAHNFSQDRSVEEILDLIFPDEDEVEISRIKSIVAVLILWYPIRTAELQLKVPLLRMSELYRALLYGGAMKIMGSELENKQLARIFRDLAIDLAGEAFKGLGILKALAELLNLSDPAQALPSVEAAHEVDRYLAKYTRTLIEWTEAALQLEASLLPGIVD